jgi:large subunit GTPase 1
MSNQLGRSLEKKKTNYKKKAAQVPLSSILEESQIDDLVNYCGATESVIVVRNGDKMEEQPASYSKGLTSDSFISLPRKPRWEGMEGNAEDYQRLEEKEFFRWRAQLALLEQSNSHLIMTPFERSLGIWRELWKAVEKADVLVQVLDARNPIFFFSQDLFKYSLEVNEESKHLLVMNKADLLTSRQRLEWSDYFEKLNVNVIFFSNIPDHKSAESTVSCPVSSAPELLERIKQMLPGNNGVVSFVGYPNVGKSSTINSLLGQSKAAVSSTPGKTKHIQTFDIGDFTICDCPGLVFPNMATSKGELILNGVMSVDQMREYLPPVQLMADRIPFGCIEKLYNIKIIPEHQVSTAESILSAYAASRGMFTSNFGNPDMSRAARTVLKDYTSGKLLFCYPPPGHDVNEFNSENIPQELPESRPIMDVDIIRPDQKPSGSGFGINNSKQVKGSGKKHFKMNKRL